MDQFSEFLTRLGNLHDSEIIDIEIVVEAGIINLRVADLLANQEEYHIPVEATISLFDVESIEIDLSGRSRKIMDFEYSDGVTSVTFWPSGKLTIKHAGVQYPEGY